MKKSLRLIFLNIFDFNSKIDRKDFLISFIFYVIFFILVVIAHIKLFLYFNKSTFILTEDPIGQVKLAHKNWYWIWLLIQWCLTFQFISLSIKRLNYLNESKLWVIPPIFVLIGLPDLPLINLTFIFILLMYFLSLRFIYLIFIKMN
jgi:uncharacterized membrane protein YhaH (DUF805 family)